jgi:hypothetical protein
MKPPKSILDPTFLYTPSTHTSVAATFARIRKEMEEANLKNQIDGKVVPIRKEEAK